MRAILVCALSVVGCSAASKAARIGEKALERGDLPTAATAYAQACDLSDEKAWCEQAQMLFTQFRNQVVAAAQPICLEPSNSKRCLELLGPARAIHDDPQLTALADIAGASWLATCQQIPIPTPVDAVLRHRCVASLEAAVNTPRYRDAAALERRGLAESVASEARASAERGYTAQALGLTQLARCLAPSFTAPVPESTLQASLDSRLAVAMSVAGDGLFNDRQIAAAVQHSAGRRVSLSAGGDIGVRVSLNRVAPTHRVFDEAFSKEYVVRRDVFTNPEWLRLRSRRDALQDAVRNAESNHRTAEDRCSAARHDEHRRHTESWECSRASSLESDCRSAKSDLSSVESDLRSTPEQLVHEVRDTYHWVRRTHRWNLPYTMALRAAGDGFADQTSQLSFSFESQEQAGFAPADVEEIRPSSPNMAHFDAQAREATQGHLRTWLDDGLASLSGRRATTCNALNDAPARRECEAGAVFLRGIDPGTYVVAQLERQAEAKGASNAGQCVR